MTTNTTLRAAQLADLRNWAPDTAKAVEEMPDEKVASAWADEEKRFRARMMEKTAGQVLYESVYSTLFWSDQDDTIQAIYETDAAAVIAWHEATTGANLRDLLRQALPHVQASAGAAHLTDGFRPKAHPLDDLVAQIKEAVGE